MGIELVGEAVFGKGGVAAGEPAAMCGDRDLLHVAQSGTFATCGRQLCCRLATGQHTGDPTVTRSANANWFPLPRFAGSFGSYELLFEPSFDPSLLSTLERSIP